MIGRATTTNRRAGLTAGGRRLGSLPHPGVLAAGLAIAGIALLPLGYLVLRAIAADPSGLALLVRPRTLEVIAGTLLLAGTVGAATAAIGVPLAWLTSRTDLPARRAWTILVLAPLAIPSYVIAFAFVSAFGPRGAIQGLLAPLGIDQIPSLYGFPGAALVLTLSSYPFVVLATRAGLARVDRHLEDAARSLGDSPPAHFRRVTLPLLVPAIVAGVLLAVLYTLSDFGAVAILRFDSLARAAYLQYQTSFDRQLAALLALVLVGIALLVTVWETALHRRSARARPAAQGRQAPLVRLGRWRWPAVTLCAGVVVIALVIPAATVTWWLIRGVANGEPVLLLDGAAIRSAVAGASAALLAVALALPIAFLSIRSRGIVARWVETGVYVPYAMPGIALALGVVFVAANLVPVLYQTLALLVLVIAMRFLPQAVAPIRVSLLQSSARLPEAARSLGRGPVGVFTSVTVPLLWPGVLAGAALVFLTTVKELPITLLIAPIGFDTLATAIWGFASEGFYARAAGPALVLMLLSGLSLGLLLRHEGRR